MFPPETHILVVDDSLNIRRMIIESLHTMGFKKIIDAENVNEALNKIEAQKVAGTPIQLILSDLNMPGPSGLEFLKKIRSQGETKGLPFILITTESEKGAVIEAATSGVSGYIVKPFNIETLSRRLLEAFKKHGKPAAS